MGKRSQRYIDRDFNSPDSIRADNIPYSATESIKDAIDAINPVNTGMSKNGIDVGETVTIPQNHHWIVKDNFYIDGTLICDGDLILV